MKLHGNAALSLNARRRMVRRVCEQRWSLAKAAEAAEVSERTCSKWVRRFRAEGQAGLLDRSSAPRSIPTARPRIASRRSRRCGGWDDRRGDRVLFRDGALDGVGGLDADRAGQAVAARAAETPNRYERRRAGELLHVDVKKLGKIRVAGHRVTGKRNHRAPPTRPTAGGSAMRAGSSSTSASTTRPGWPTSRCSPTRKPPPRPAFCAAPSPSMAVTASPSSVSCPTTAPVIAPPSTRSPAGHSGCVTCAHAPTGHKPTENKRFIRTLVAGWAYGAIYATSAERTAALDGWLWTYNHRRPHGALSHKPPIAYLNELNNLPGSYLVLEPGLPGKRVPLCCWPRPNS